MPYRLHSLEKTEVGLSCIAESTSVGESCMHLGGVHALNCISIVQCAKALVTWLRKRKQTAETKPDYKESLFEMFSSEMRNMLQLISLNLLIRLQGECYNMTTLPCRAHLESGVMYRKISWYKVEEGLTGLVLKNLKTNQTVLYKSANHSYQIGEDLSLILPTSALNDCGKYHCTLWAPIGHKIQEGECSYYPQGCPDPPETHLTKALPSRLSSSSAGGCVASEVMAGTGAMALLLIVLSVGMWKCKARQQKKYMKVPI